MRLRVLKPQPFAALKRWRWQIVGERDVVLAESSDESEAECENGIREIQAAFRAGKTLEVEEMLRPFPSPPVVRT